MKLQIKIITTLLLLLVIGRVSSQNYIEIGQYMYHQAFFNPSAIGSYNDIRIAGLVRQQWVGVDGAPRVYSVNAAIPFEKMGLGFTLTQSEIGVHKETRVFASYSYRLKLQKNHYLSFGISGGGVLQNVDYSSVITRESNDDLFSADISSTFTPDFQLGIYYLMPRFYFSIFIPSMLTSEVRMVGGEEDVTTNFDAQQVHLYFQGGYEYPLSDDFHLNLSTLIRYVSSLPLEYDLNAMLGWKGRLGVGFSYRSRKEFFALFNVGLTEHLKLCYAYQNSSIVHDHFSSHEVMLIYAFKRNNKRRIRIQSPRF
ncbi:PorP/SprF family type IX secretion system membrane protein [Halosquirtibacter xylanolyticus]|uniref:PorP/SprF family type IX secretion system membrane protein n=1 Tax=Halosquirtibacter xylanolyticus TaxID=3374599 RepID=UPI0037482F5E|nr:PorP/SprF family type IX secretion system membrane protein [Prolixibacteraceae bacterium]